MVAFSCARATALAAAFFALCRPSDALHLHRAAASSESVAPRDLEASLLAAKITANPLFDEVQKPDEMKIHVHFHKAGGTLMCNLARAAGETTPMPETLNCNWKNHDGLRASGNISMFPSCADRHAHYKAIGWTYSQMEREVVADDFCDGIKYSCLFRDPIDLIMSNINYEETGDYGPGHATGQNCTTRVGHMRELISEGLTAAGSEYDHMPGLVPTVGWKFMDNMQTRLLSGAIDVPPGQLTREHLEKAKHRLAKFHAVAKLEDMKDPVKRGRFFAKMGWNITLEVPHDNTAEHVDGLSAVDRLWLTELNKYDYELYRSLD